MVFLKMTLPTLANQLTVQLMERLLTQVWLGLATSLGALLGGLLTIPRSRCRVLLSVTYSLT